MNYHNIEYKITASVAKKEKKSLLFMPFPVPFGDQKEGIRQKSFYCQPRYMLKNYFYFSINSFFSVPSCNYSKRVGARLYKCNAIRHLQNPYNNFKNPKTSHLFSLRSSGVDVNPATAFSSEAAYVPVPKGNQKEGLPAFCKPRNSAAGDVPAGYKLEKLEKAGSMPYNDINPYAAKLLISPRKISPSGKDLDRGLIPEGDQKKGQATFEKAEPLNQDGSFVQNNTFGRSFFSNNKKVNLTSNARRGFLELFVNPETAKLDLRPSFWSPSRASVSSKSKTLKIEPDNNEKKQMQNVERRSRNAPYAAKLDIRPRKISPSFWSPSGMGKGEEALNVLGGFYNNKVVSITYEEIGLFPRSFSRVLDRFLKQIFSNVDTLIIQEYRFYRYLFLTTFKTILILLLVPFLVNLIVKNNVVRPLTEYFWNKEQTEIFLNSFQQTRAFAELQDFEEKLYFESLLTLADRNKFFNGLMPVPDGDQKEGHIQKVHSENVEDRNTLSKNIKKSIRVEPNGEASGEQLKPEPPSLLIQKENTNKKLLIDVSLEKKNPYLCSASLRQNAALSSFAEKVDLAKLSLENPYYNVNPGGGLLGALKSTLDIYPFGWSPSGTGLDPNFNFKTDHKYILISLEAVLDPQKKDVGSTYKNGKLAYNLAAEDSLAIQQRLQEKTIELAVQYNNESIEAITNLFADFLSFLTLLYLIMSLEIQINITKSFLLEVFFGLEDSKKCLLILLVTDLLVGYHSPDSWELLLESLFSHYGIPTSQTVILLLVATLPVLLDVLFKYLIFRHLNRSSPTTVATYQALIE